MICASSVGEVWLQSMDYVIKEGEEIEYRDTHLLEVLNLQIIIDNPEVQDKIVQKYGSTEMLEYMKNNFQNNDNIHDRGYSYKKRIFDHLGVNQLEYALNNLNKRKNSMDAIFSLLSPTEDEKHVPCLAMLQFLTRKETLIVTATFKSIDIGKKCYGDFIEIIKLFRPIQQKLQLKNLRLIANISSAHIYQDDLENVNNILKRQL